MKIKRDCLSSTTIEGCKWVQTAFAVVSFTQRKHFGDLHLNEAPKLISYFLYKSWVRLIFVPADSEQSTNELLDIHLLIALKEASLHGSQ